MIGGWRPWERWMVARRLGRHARREGGEPPPDLLRRLREDIPASPELLRHLERPPVAAGAGGQRRGASRRPWLAAASVAAALTAGVVGLRVWQQHSRDAGRRLHAFSEPGFAPAAESRQANPQALPPPAPPSPVAAPAKVAPPAPPAPPAVAAPAPPSSTAASRAQPFAASSKESLGALGYLSGPARPGARGGGRPVVVPGGTAAGPGETAGGVVGGVAQSPNAAAGAAGGARDTAEAPEARSEGGVPSAAAPSSSSTPQLAAPRPFAAPPPPVAAAPPPLASGAEAKAAMSPAARPARPPAPAAPLRSSFGADTGVDSYRRVRRGLLGEGHLPRAASVRADELANAFDLAAEVQAVGRPELSVEGAPLPAAGAAAYLLRFEVRGLTGRSSPDAVEVDFDPAVVARFRRVGATAHRGGAAALYEVELRKAAAGVPAAPAAPAAQEVTAESRPGTAAAAPRAAAAPQMTAASPRPPAEPPAAPASRPGGGPQDRVIATLRVVPRDERSMQDGALLAARVVRLSELHPSWDAASPALRVQGLAVQLAQALAARDPAQSLQALRARAQALAAELPEDPKAAELLQLVDRAADLAGEPGGEAPRPP